MKKIITICFLFAAIITKAQFYTIVDSCSDLIIQNTTNNRSTTYPKSQLYCDTSAGVLNLRSINATILASWNNSNVSHFPALSVNAAYHKLSSYLSYTCVHTQCCNSGGGVVYADNGLTAIVDTIQLGGILLHPTLINAHFFPFDVFDTTTGGFTGNGYLNALQFQSGIGQNNSMGMFYDIANDSNAVVSQIQTSSDTTNPFVKLSNLFKGKQTQNFVLLDSTIQVFSVKGISLTTNGTPIADNGNIILNALSNILFTQLGNIVITNTPTYNSSTAAQADVALPTGAIYKISVTPSAGYIAGQLFIKY